MGVKCLADGKVTIDSELNDKGLDKGLQGLQGKLEGAGKKLQSIGGSLTKNLTLPLVAAGTGALLTAKNFDDSMRKVKATMGDSLGDTTAEVEKNFKSLREEAIQLGATTAFSASEAASAMEEMALKGWDTNQILEGTTHVLNLASAAGMDLAESANIMTGTMAAFSLEADKAEWAADMLQTTASSSGTTVEQLGMAMEMAGGNAAAAGMDLEQTNAILGALANTNITGSKAGTTFNAMLSDLKSSAKDGVVDFGDFKVALYDANGEMKDMGSVLAEMEKEMDGMSTSQRDAAMAAVFGEQAQRGVNSIMAQGTDVVKDLEQAMKDGEGAAKDAAEEMEGGIGGSLRALASAAESLAISFGDVLAPHVQKAAEFLAQLALKFSNLSDKSKQIITIVGGILAALGPLLTMVGTFIVIMSKAAAAIMAINPIVLVVIGVIGALVAAGIALYKNWDTVKEKAISVFSHFEPLLDTVKEAFEKLKASATPILENLKGLWESLVPLLQKLGAVVGGVLATSFGIAISVFNAAVAAIGPLINAVISLADFVVNTVNLIIAVLTGDFAGAMDYWNEMTESAINFFVSLWEGVVNFIGTFVDTIVDFFYGLYMTLVGNSIIPDMVEEIVDWFKDMFDWLIDIVSSIIDGIVAGFTFIYETIQKHMEMAKEILIAIWGYIENTFKNALDFLVGLVTGDFGKMKNAINNQMENAKNLLRNIWSAIDKFLSSVLGDMWGNIKSKFSAMFNTISNTTSNIKNKMTEIFNSLKGIVTNAFTGVKDAISDGIEGALSIVTNIASKFFDAGKNIVSSIIGGIKNAAGDIGGAIGSVAGSIRNFLPFSPAKEGPLKDLNKLDFGGPIEDSLKNAIPDVQAKMNAMLELPNKDYDSSERITSTMRGINKLVGDMARRQEARKDKQKVVSGDVVLDGREVGKVMWEEVQNRTESKKRLRDRF